MEIGFKRKVTTVAGSVLLGLVYLCTLIPFEVFHHHDHGCDDHHKPEEVAQCHVEAYHSEEGSHICLEHVHFDNEQEPCAWCGTPHVIPVHIYSEIDMPMAPPEWDEPQNELLTIPLKQAVLSYANKGPPHSA